jgi:hypothetical protein
MAAVESLADLTVVAAWLVALGLAYLAYQLSQAIANVIDIHIPLIGNPFHGLAVALENSIVSWTEQAVKASEAGIARGISGLIDSMGLLIGLAALLYIGVRKALVYGWGTAIPALVETAVRPVRTLASKAETTAESATSLAWANLTRAEAYADKQSASALTDAQLQALRDAENAAVTHAMQVAADGIAAAEAKAQQLVAAAEAQAEAGITEAEALARSGVSQAEAQAQSALAASEAAASSALDIVRSVAVGAEQDLRTIEGTIGAAGVAALIAAIPALATLVNTLVTETGLENQSCRTKVKGICGTDPSAWENLLFGIAAAGVALDFRQFVSAAAALAEPARVLISELE